MLTLSKLKGATILWLLYTSLQAVPHVEKLALG